MPTDKNLQKLQNKLTGSLHTDALHKSLYATDASVYRKTPLAVAIPKTEEDLLSLIAFADEHNTSLTPRTAGTSLAGQCVNGGIIVDTSKYFNQIKHIDSTHKTVTLQPGVIRDVLNTQLKEYGLFFGPNTSTSNRCMIGGMVGNNSSGTTSIQYGVTRDKVISLKALLSDGSKVVFESLSSEDFVKKTKGKSLENKIYAQVYEELSNPEIQKEIRDAYPNAEIHRRNTGYAVDELLKSELFGGTEKTINLAKLLCGSEGTLAITTEITLQLDDLPPPHAVMVGAHFESLQESLEAVVVAMQHNLYTCELMDKIILDCTKNNHEQQKNRFFLQGEPKAILMLEVVADTPEKAEDHANKLIAALQSNNFGYHYPKIKGADIAKVHELRKAGLGLLGNIIGDEKAVACIEDTAVALKDLPTYIGEFTEMMDAYGQEAVYYAHAGAGEIHLRPILNLKKKADVALFREITTQTAKLVKRYNGSFSGEHGDGIVRSEFIPMMIGEKNYGLLHRIKEVFDPKNILNPGKITNPLAMDANLRYKPERKEPEIDTLMDFTDNQGILRFTEKCNGSGDCRKTTGGTMCPSYRATKNEKDTTRGRANALRDFLTQSEKKNQFNHKELKEVFDLCLSCKACASECPSNVDISTLKAEFLFQYHKENGIPMRSRLFAHSAQLNKLATITPKLSNLLLNSSFAKKIIGIAPERNLPQLQSTTLRSWYHKNKKSLNAGSKHHGKIVLFCDEFTNYYDVEIGTTALQFFAKIGYEPVLLQHEESGRAAISKGLLKTAQKFANTNTKIFRDIINDKVPLVGIEPSAILTFRDEYLRLSDDKENAKIIAKHTYTIEEFLQKLIDAHVLTTDMFHNEHKDIKIHGHCHQKALSSMAPTFNALNLPKNYQVSILNTGCCGMAGSFGYEKEHYQTSLKVAEESLFPKLRKLSCDTHVAAAGTSCRHQIFDGLQKKALHPIQFLHDALLDELR